MITIDVRVRRWNGYMKCTTYFSDTIPRVGESLVLTEDDEADATFLVTEIQHIISDEFLKSVTVLVDNQ